MLVKWKKNPLDAHIGKKLREIRTLVGMSQDDVGEIIGVTMQQVQKYETAHNRISASKLYEFAQSINKPIHSFFEDYVADNTYSNIDFKPEKKCLELESHNQKEIHSLLVAFNQIEDLQIKKDFIVLAKSIASGLKPKY
jgi:transcriptional regulator with XRE-family HTH domain